MYDPVKNGVFLLYTSFYDLQTQFLTNVKSLIINVSISINLLFFVTLSKAFNNLLTFTLRKLCLSK